MTTELPTLQPEHSKASDFWSFTFELIKTAVIVGVMAYLLRLFVLQPFIVEGSSMQPEFQTNDYLLVDKFSYHIREPKRGDIIVFRYPFNPTVNYVKRIIGLPGERVLVDKGKITIFNNTYPDGLHLTEPYLTENEETLLPSGAVRSEYVVPNDKYFVLGDNRSASSDSREWGFLPQEEVVGRVIIQAFPLGKFHYISPTEYQRSSP